MKRKFLLIIFLASLGLTHAGMDRMDYYVPEDDVDEARLAETTDAIDDRSKDWTLDEDYDEDEYNPTATEHDGISGAGREHHERSETEFDDDDRSKEKPAATEYDVSDNDVGGKNDGSYDGEAYDGGNGDYGGISGASKLRPHSGSKISKSGYYNNPHYGGYGGHGAIKYVHRNYGPK